MTFAIFNKDNLPTVKVTFTGEPITQERYDEFIENWNECDRECNDYNYYFDTFNGLGNPSLKYAISIAGFIMRKKREKPIYLKHSIIYAYTSTTRTLLRLIFNLSSPIAPVYIIDDNDENYISIIQKYIATYKAINSSYPKILPCKTNKSKPILVFMP